MSLKILRDRIDSVKKTKKLVEGMRLVAMTKVRRAQEQVLATRPFADALAQVLYRLRLQLQFEDLHLSLLEEREPRTVGLVIIANDRGMCGSYFANLIRRAERRARELQAQGLNYQYVTVGAKASQHFQRQQESIAYNCDRMGQIPSAIEASRLNDQLLAMFFSETVDRIELIYSKFVSLMSDRPVIQTLLPIAPQGLEVIDDEIFRLTTLDRKLYVERRKIAPQIQVSSQEMLFEQNPQQLLDALLPLYLNNQLLRALQEAAASEIAARLRAMTNASENASQLIEQLTIIYNKARQAAITEEILEVVSGAEALTNAIR